MSWKQTRSAFMEPGEIVSANVLVRDAAETVKIRPVVLVAPKHDARPETSDWLIMGLTSKPVSAQGEERILSPQRLKSADRDSWLHGPRRVYLPPHEIWAHIQWANDELVDAVADLFNLSTLEAEAMRPQARADRNRFKRRTR